MMTHFDHLAVAINTGTNIPSVAHPQRAGRLPVPADQRPRPGHPPVLPAAWSSLALPYTITMSIHRLGRYLLLLLVAARHNANAKGPRAAARGPLLPTCGARGIPPGFRRRTKNSPGISESTGRINEEPALFSI